MQETKPGYPATDDKPRPAERIRGLFEWQGDKDMGHRFLIRLTAFAIAMALVVLGAGVAWAETTIDSNDVVLSGAAATSGGATLVREGVTDSLSIAITADDGNIADNSNVCDGTNNAAKTLSDYAVTSSAVALSGTEQTLIFSCTNFEGRNGSPETLTFTGLTVGAAADAPLGTSTRTITFGSASTDHVRLGSQLVLDGGFTNPTIKVNVNPRPVTNLSAVAGNQEITLNWTGSPDAAGITDHKIYDGTTVVGSPAKTAVSHTVSGLTNGTEYCYTIKARYNDGTTDFFSTAPTAVCATPVGSSVSYDASYKQPIDLGAVNIAKLGRIVPVKVEILGSDGSEIDTGTVQLVGNSIACGATLSATDTVESYAGSSNSGNAFRWDSDGGFWIYNLDTKGLSGANTCYQFGVVYDGTVLQTGFQLKLTK